MTLEGNEPSARYHAVAEEGIAGCDIAKAIGAGLNVPVKSITPEEAADRFGWLGAFAGMELPASSAWTRQVPDWHPAGPGLIADLKRMDYSGAGAA